MREASERRMATDTDSYAFSVIQRLAQFRGVYRVHMSTMSEMNKNEELHSRRQFFKKAAKATLPILGATILAASPLKIFASESNPTGCSGACSWSCQNTCRGTCQGCRGCSGACSYSCTTTCHGGCRSGNVY